MNKKKKTILISAYTCNPFGVSESLAAFNFVNILLQEYNIILLTTKENEFSIKEFYQKTPINTSASIRIISFKDSYPGKQIKVINDSIKVGYFIFNQKIKKYLRNNLAIIDEADLLYHKSPSSFRYFSWLFKFNKPFVFGPTGGGLQNPKILRTFFKSENRFLKLRILDKFLLQIPLYKNHFTKAENILITLPYVKNILGQSYNLKYVEILDTGINTDKHIPAKISPKNPRICFVGRLTPYKGAELLLKAVFQISSLYPDLRVDFVGDGEEREKLENFCKTNRLENVVTFHGHIPHNQIEKIYHNSTIFCFPTLTEASGNSILEAMSYGLPIITVNNGGPKYMCPENGAIKVNIDHPEKMIDSISKAIEKLIRNESLRQTMGENNRKYCVENFDWKVMEKKILDFFQSKFCQN